ncbi:hypothetical protein [Solibacillus isronensis]|uniref:hypothetical protein n=1 Tax=Solibacillus isronensis TaxID=412383 RepID=UPI0009A7899E|nr:hypothetical protein [Solibacillus isronensis]
MSNYSSIINLAHMHQYKIDEQLKKSLQDVYWRIESNHYHDLIAEIEGQTIKSLGISWGNPNHPLAKYIHFSSNATEELLNKMLTIQAPYDRIVFSCWEDEVEKIKLLQMFPFQLFRKTYMEKYEIHTLVEKLDDIAVPETLLSLKKVLTQPSLEEELFKLLKHSYEQTHLDNPAQTEDWLAWKEKLLEDNPDLELSFVAIENYRVVAYLFVHPIDEKHYEMGWVGQQGNVNLLPILKKQLISLQNKGIRSVEFEVDTTDYNAWQFADLLDLKSKKGWYSYIFKNN